MYICVYIHIYIYIPACVGCNAMVLHANAPSVPQVNIPLYHQNIPMIR